MNIFDRKEWKKKDITGIYHKWQNMVYDVTPFMDDHPGGDEVLLSATGKDATNDFEDVGHSDNAREMMEKYYIAEIDVATVPLKRTYIAPQQTTYNPDKTPEFVIKQMMSMGCGIVPMMFPGVQQYMLPMGMGMGMRMNRPMVPFSSVMPGSTLQNPAAAVHLSPRFPIEAWDFAS